MIEGYIDRIVNSGSGVRIIGVLQCQQFWIRFEYERNLPVAESVCQEIIKTSGSMPVDPLSRADKPNIDQRDGQDAQPCVYSDLSRLSWIFRGNQHWAPI